MPFKPARAQALPFLLLLLICCICRPALAVQLHYCVFDPLGTSGDYFSMAKDYQLEAKRWGVDLVLDSYTNDSLAAEDFKAGQCDITNMIGLRARLFNEFTGTLDAPGAIENYSQMRTMLTLMASPKLAKMMVSGPFEVAGILPLGATYNFVNDRQMNTIPRFVNKKIAVMAWDKVESIMVEQFGAIPVGCDTTNFAGKFNNGTVDIAIAPIIVYKPFELYKGLGTKGGIIRRPVGQLSMQLMIRHDKFPAEFGMRSREYVAQQQDHAFGVVRNMENEVEQHYWLYMSTTEHNEFYRIVRDGRAYLAKNGFYDKRMLNIMKRVRCGENPSDAECSTGEE